MTASVIFGGMYIMESKLRPELRKRNPEEGDRIMKQMWILATTGQSDV
jgi:hypothetical protein